MSKTILRVEKNKDNPFVMIDRRPIENPKLSWRAKGMLAYLLSRPDDWVVRLGDLVKRSSDGTHTVRAALHELMDAGHIHKQTIREGGRIKQWVYVIHEIPRPPDCEIQEVEIQHLVNRTLNNTNKDTKNESTNIDDKDTASLRKLSDLYTTTIGMVTPLMSDILRNAAIDYPSEWFDKAFEIAVKNNARRWNYIETILDGWKRNGYGWKPERAKPKQDRGASFRADLERMLTNG